jgi:hypothetical protein
MKNDKEFTSVLARLNQSSYLINDDDLKILLSKISDDKDKLSLLSYFVPRLSYQEAMDL